MIAIAVAAALVAYAWIMGYIGGTTIKAGKAIQIQSYAIDDSGNLIVYVQNVGVGQVQLKADGSVYLGDNLVGILTPSDPLIAIDEGKTVTLVLNYQYHGEWIKIKVVTAEGTFTETSGQPKSGGTSTQYSVNFILGPNGQSMSPSGAQSYGSGARVAISATPLANYVFDQWILTGLVSVDDPGSASTFATINGAGTVTATFIYSAVTHTITASAGLHGQISPSGAVTVNEHADKTFDIAADIGYHVADVLVDTVSIGPQVTYTFTDVIAAHTISASFAANPPATHTISASASANGIIDPSGGVVVTHGDDQPFTFTPNTGYHVADVLVDSVSVGAPTSYTFTNVIADHTIVANFAIDTFTITVTPGPHGLIKLNGNPVSGDVTFNDGDTPTFDIVPGSGYQVAGVVVDSVSQGKISQYTFPPIHANHAISATFEEIPVNHAPVIDSYSPLSDPTVAEGGSQAFSITCHDPDGTTPTVSWLLDGNNVGSGLSYTYSPDYSSSGPHTVKAVASDGSLTAEHQWAVTVTNTPHVHYIDTNNPSHDTNVGTLSNFANMQNDAVSYATLTEADTDSSTGTMGTSHASDTGRTTVAANIAIGQQFIAAGSGAIQSVTFHARGDSSTVSAKVFITDSSGNILTNGISNVVSGISGSSGSDADYVAYFATPPVVQSGQTYRIMVVSNGNFRLYYYDNYDSSATSIYDSSNSYTAPQDLGSGVSTANIDYRRLYASINYDNYRLDQEVQFSGVTNSASYTQLQINTGTFSGSEGLEVYYWRSSDSTWQLLGTLTASSLNTFDVTGLVGTTFDLRFYDATRTSDATQNTWQIDYVRLVAP